MAPVVPSPHRFLANQQRLSLPEQVNQDVSQKVQTRWAEESEVTNDLPNNRPSSSAQQFAQAPRFGRSARLLNAPTPARPSIASVMLSRHDTIDSVEEATCSEHPTPGNLTHDRIEIADTGENDEMLLDGGEETDVMPTTEVIPEHAWSQELPYSPTKRRKLQANEIRETRATTPSKTTFLRPSIPASANRPQSSSTPHFVRGTVAAGASGHVPSLTSRPVFLPPSSNDEFSSHPPLPEAFSPHRRGQKFIPGGLAATVQQWIVQAGQSAASTYRDNGDDFVFTLEVQGICGSGPCIVRGRRRDTGSKAEVLLSANSRVHDGDLRAGAVIGVRAPTWEVDGNGQGSKCMVAVDWRLTS